MDEFLSAADAARLLGVVPATVRHMERDGKLPATRPAGGFGSIESPSVPGMSTSIASPIPSTPVDEMEATPTVEPAT